MLRQHHANTQADVRTLAQWAATDIRREMGLFAVRSESPGTSGRYPEIRRWRGYLGGQRPVWAANSRLWSEASEQAIRETTFFRPESSAREAAAILNGRVAMKTAAEMTESSGARWKRWKARVTKGARSTTTRRHTVL